MIYEKKVRISIIIKIIILLSNLISKMNYVLSKVNSKPRFAIPIIRYKDGVIVKYYGLGTVTKYNILDGRNDVVFKYLFTK